MSPAFNKIATAWQKHSSNDNSFADRSFHNLRIDSPDWQYLIVFHVFLPALSLSLSPHADSFLMTSYPRVIINRTILFHISQFPAQIEPLCASQAYSERLTIGWISDKSAKSISRRIVYSLVLKFSSFPLTVTVARHLRQPQAQYKIVAWVFVFSAFCKDCNSVAICHGAT